jgi:hypothetical protein
MLAAVLVTGNRTVSGLVRLIGLIEYVNPSTYHRVFSHRRWMAVSLAKIIIRFILDRYLPTGTMRICGDETVDGHRGKNVYGKALHRDAVRSSHSHTVFRYGHKWIVLAILVEFPSCNRPFALPVLVALYRDKKTNHREGRRHKTSVELMCGLLALLIRWFPERKWQFAGDGGYGSHEFARFAHRHRLQTAALAKKASRWPNLKLSWLIHRKRNSKFVGTEAEHVTSKSLPESATGSKVDSSWSQYGGFTFEIAAEPIATSTSSRPIRK